MTNFEASVYNVVRKIPRGRLLTYGQVAALVGRPRAARAAGHALSRNPRTFLSKFKTHRVPCHRVVAAGGSLGGYNGGRSGKIALLRKEGIRVKKNKIINFSTHQIGLLEINKKLYDRKK